MYIPKQPLIQNLVDALRHEAIKPLAYYAELEIRFRQTEPDILAFIPEKDGFQRLASEVQALGAQYTQPKNRPPLYCLPVGVKDIFHVDGFLTSAGSQLPPERLTGPEADCVTILKNLGTLTFGKTVTTEFAYFAPGPTRNPYNLAHSPGGSSSGSAAAVAAGIIPFAFGTQTIGSIIRPASYCGVVGFKPTYDRISSRGVIPVSPSVDTIGFFTQDVASAQFMAGFLCRGWHLDMEVPPKPVLGIPAGPYLTHTNMEMAVHFKNTCVQLEDGGYRLKQVPVMNDFDDIYQRHNLIVAVEAAQTHQGWYQEFGPKYHLKTTQLIERGLQASSADYEAALQAQQTFRQRLTTLMKAEGIDLWLSPPAQGAAPKGLGSTGDPIMNLPWTYGGFPALNIPAGLNQLGLPMGLQVVAGWNQDEALLEWSLDIEKCLSIKSG